MKKTFLILAAMLCCITLNAQQPAGDGSQTTPYQIATSDNLVWFANHVNSGNASACAVLTADIVVNSGVLNEDGTLNGSPQNIWTPIGGQNGRDYSGEFNGGGHTISGLYFNDGTKNNVGLFGKAVGSAHIHDLGVRDSYFYGGSWVGGICGDFASGRIENCWSGATVMSNGNGSCAGGIAASCWTDASIAGCYNTGKISCTGSSYGGISGVLAKNSNVDASVKDCFTLNTACGVICNDLRDNPAITNSDVKDAAAFASGEVCYKLNHGVTDNSQKWYQTLGGTDNFPVLDKSHGTVYYGYDGNVLKYSNSPLDPSNKASYIDANGEPQTADNVTEITNSSSTLSAGWYVVRGSDVKTGTLTCNGHVHLILADGAKLTVTGIAGDSNTPGTSGIRVSGEGTSLTIYGQTAQSGQLIANGGSRGAGIGGGNKESGSNITINGGIVTANGGYYAAGIGGGSNGSGSNITINGGLVAANGGDCGAGIGGGYNGHGSNITISDGTVTATGGNWAAGIGGGYYGSGSDNIRVDADLIVRADETEIAHTSSTDIAGYLSGKRNVTITSNVLPVPISVSYIDENGVSQTVDADVVAHSVVSVTWGTAGTTTWYVVNDVDVQLARGAVCNGDVRLILADGAKLTAAGVNDKAGIQVSGDGNSLTIYCQTAQTGQLFATGGNQGAGIGGGNKGSGSNITINGGTVTATGGDQAAGIGGGREQSGSNITIKGGTVTATGGNQGAGIGGGNKGNGSNINIVGGEVTANGVNGAAGIGGGREQSGSGITIVSGTVTATGGDWAAGIGGGYRGNGSNITIDGGKVTATAGKESAGIGGGQHGSGSVITINDGVVTAIGDNGGTGIGGGREQSGSDIIIKGGTVTATGGDWSAGIGGGYRGNGSNITVDGGKVTATGGKESAGIGGGHDGSGSNIFVATALTVYAGNATPPTNEISHTDNDIASYIAALRYVIVKDVATGAKQAAIAAINAAIEGVTNADIIAIATNAINAINAATSVDVINAIKEQALADIASAKAAYNSAFGEMGEPCEDCPAVDVTKGTTTIRLYSPEKVEFRKE